MKRLLLLSLLSGLWPNAWGQTSYLLVNTQRVFTINWSDNPSIYWNRDLNRANDLESAPDLANGSSVYYELTNGRRTAKLILSPRDSASMMGGTNANTGTYYRFSDKRTFPLLSQPVYALQGRWNVTMNISESDCRESPVGQQRTEIWHIQIGPGEMAQVGVSDNGGTTVSHYTGLFDGAYLRLSAKVDGLLTVKARATAILLLQNYTTLMGTRQMNRNDPCSIRSIISAKRL